MHLNKFLLIFILKVSLLQANIERDRPKVLTKLVKELIENEKVHSTLWAETCWTKLDDFNFIKSFSIPIQIARYTAPTIDLPTDEHINKQWFFIDMNCGERSINLLSNIDEKYFAHPFRWIIVDASLDSIKNLTFLPDSNVILANREILANENSVKYTLKQGNFILFLTNVFLEYNTITEQLMTVFPKQPTKSGGVNPSFMKTLATGPMKMVWLI